jgi:hypothetical protein
MKEVKIYKSPWKVIRMMLLASIFVIIGIYMLSKPGAPVFLAWLSILFFGMAYPFGLFQLFDRRPQIIINEIGIFDRTAHKDFINWEIIQDAYLVNVQKQKFICLVVAQQFEPSRSKGKLAKNMAGLSRSLGFQELNISLGNVRINEERLMAFILAMRSAERVNRDHLISKMLSEAGS